MGFLDQQAADQVLNRDQGTSALGQHLRGWSGVSNRIQALDRQGRIEHGWDWLSYRRHGEILDADSKLRRWKVRLDYEHPDGYAGRCEGVVIVTREIPDTGCGRQWGESEAVSLEYGLESWSSLPGHGALDRR